MKHVLPILAFILMTNYAEGQIVDSTLQKLIDHKLQKQTKAFLDLLKRMDEVTKASYLEVLFQEEYKKVTGHHYSIFFYVAFAKDSLNRSEELKRNSELFEYLSRLNSIDFYMQINWRYLHQQEEWRNNRDIVYCPHRWK